jgi:hypothetical protein
MQDDPKGQSGVVKYGSLEREERGDESLMSRCQGRTGVRSTRGSVGKGEF